MLILGASIGECIHVAGLLGFLKVAEEAGHSTQFLGAAIEPEQLVKAAARIQPHMLAISYRLSPDPAAALFADLRSRLNGSPVAGVRLVFGGTPQVAEVARASGLFERVFDGTQRLEEIKEFLLGEGLSQNQDSRSSRPPDSLTERVDWKRPYPLIRHHFGLPTMDDTLRGVERLADSQLLDILSIGPDQNAQVSFFRPDEMDHGRDGAGGVPVRSPDDFRMLYYGSRRGNYPLMRCYAGTRDLVSWAEMLQETIHNAWGAVPVFWYSELDRRSNRPLQQAIEENQAAISWHAARGIPVEVNDSHQWSLRACSDAIAVAAAYIAGVNARRLNVRDYVMQYMFGNPAGTSYPMDLAKMLAKQEILKPLVGSTFRVWTMVRSGLASLSSDMDVAKGQLAGSIQTAMVLKPDIVHVVAYCEANHIAQPQDIIESCKIAQGIIENCIRGLPSVSADRRILKRKKEILCEARVILDAIRSLSSQGGDEPLCDPKTLAAAVRKGILDAPQLVGSTVARGRAESRLVDGAWFSYDSSSGSVISEAERLSRLQADSCTQSCNVRTD